MVNVFKNHNIKIPSAGAFQRVLSIIPESEWHPNETNYDFDSQRYLRKCEEREKIEEKENKIPPDSTGQFSKAYSVYVDDDKKPYDTYMTKVDLKNGIYGDYVFYKL